MGMFDWVAFEMPCPKCGERVGGFQTKGLHCDLDVVLPHMTTHMYSTCEKCRTWIEFQGGRMTCPDPLEEQGGDHE